LYNIILAWTLTTVSLAQWHSCMAGHPLQGTESFFRYPPLPSFRSFDFPRRPVATWRSLCRFFSVPKDFTAASPSGTSSCTATNWDWLLTLQIDLRLFLASCILFPTVFHFSYPGIYFGVHLGQQAFHHIFHRVGWRYNGSKSNEVSNPTTSDTSNSCTCYNTVYMTLWFIHWLRKSPFMELEVSWKSTVSA
jgi:hypothetical protein